MRSFTSLYLAAACAGLAACSGPNPGVPSPTPLPPAPRALIATATIHGDFPPEYELERLGARPCPDNEFTCVTLPERLNHADLHSSETISVTFAYRRATGERRGALVVATGGPGSSGIALADSYTASFDPAIPERFDIVFFDQRGVGMSGGLQCASAVAAYYQSDVRTDTSAGEVAAIDAARRFASDCIAEMGDPSILPYLGTRQAVDDLEGFFEVLKPDKVWLYGESYGTQFAQMYALAHPDRVAGLILDGTVDLTLSGPEFLAQQAGAFNAVLVMTLEDCNAQPDCAADMGGDAVTAYDALAARLAGSPIPYTFPLPSGETVTRQFTLADLEVAAASYLYAEGDRMILLRALAASRRGDLAPLARLLYEALGLDPETLEAIPDPSYSDAVYYGVECSDYAYFDGSPDDRAQAYIRHGDAIDASGLRLSSIFYGDLPCAFWPGVPDAGRPRPLAGEGFPVLVLGATADPATPVSNGENVYRRLADGYLITVDGGPHVIFGWGNACPDETVTAFLVEGRLPDQRETRCQGHVSDAYVPLAPIDAAEFADPLEAMLSVDDEMYYLPEYWNWDGETFRKAGCPHGGSVEFEGEGGMQHYTLKACAFSRGWIMTGVGEYDSDSGAFTLEVAVAGLADGALVYTRGSDGSVRVTGEYDGQAIDLSE